MAGFWGVSRAIEPLDSNGLSNIPHISMVYWLNKPRGMLEEHKKRL